MSEFFTVVKIFLSTAILVMLLQIRIGGASMESRAQIWLQTSTTAVFLQGVAAGGVKAILNLTGTLKEGVGKAADGFSEGKRERAIKSNE